MLSTVIQKSLLEDNFMIKILENPDHIISTFKLTNEQANKIISTSNGVEKFFANTCDNHQNFISKIYEDVIFKQHVLEYSKEKFTYLLASENAGTNVVASVVWVQ